MEKGVGGGDDSARAVGMCDRFLTFLSKNLSMNRQKNITEGPRHGGDHRSHVEEEDDEFAVKIEKADFKFSHEDELHRSLPATVLEERSSDARATDQHKEAVAEASRKVAATEAALAAAEAAAQQEKKVRKSVTIKEEPTKEKEKAKKSLSKKRQASSSGAGVEEPVPRPPLRWGLRPRMPSGTLRVPSNINEKSSNFIEERKKGFGAGGKPEK